MPEKEIWTCQNNWCTFSIGTLNTWYPMGYIDVGDGCWRPNVLMTRFGCWQQVTPPISNISHRHRILAYYDDGDRCKSLRIWLKLDKIVLNLASNWISCLQNNISVTNITFWHIVMLLTAWNVTNMQEYVTNIDVTHDIQCLRVDFFSMLSINVFQKPRTKHLHKQKQFSSGIINNAWRITKKVRYKFLLPIVGLNLVDNENIR